MNIPQKPGVASREETKDLLQPLPDEPVDSRVDLKDQIAEEINNLTLDAEFAQEKFNRLVDDNRARKAFSYWIFTITVLWMFLVLMIVLQCGRGTLRLSDGVLIALITTTTANVFGFFYVVVNYLFNKDKST